MSFYQEWAWAAAIIAIPLVIFGVAEMAMLMRRRHHQTVARRSKEVQRPPSSGSRPDGTG